MQHKKLEFPHVRGELRFDYNLAHLTWFKVGGTCDCFYKPADVDDLKFFLSNLDREIGVFVLGAGSNILIRDGGVRGVVVKLGKPFAGIRLDSNTITVGAGCLNYNLAQFCLQNCIEGFEFLVGIPGTIGGGVSMNAGAYGKEFKDIISSVKALDRYGTMFEFSNEEIGFGYRKNSLPETLIFIEATFKYKIGEVSQIKSKMDGIQESRLATQPIKEKTCGSTFANTENYKAWELIQMVGMRGYTLGGAQVSEKHCNFLINTGNATAKDLEQLGDLIREKIKGKFGIELRWEIKKVGDYK